METKDQAVLVFAEEIRGGYKPPGVATHTPAEKDWREYMDECQDTAKAWLTIHEKHFLPRWMAISAHKPRLVTIAGVWADDIMVQEEWRQSNRACDLHTAIKRALTGMSYMLGPDTTMKMMNLNGRAFITAALASLDMEASPHENPALNMLAAIMADASCELYPTDPRCGYIHLSGQVGIPFRFLSAIMPIVDEYFDARDEALEEGFSSLSS